MNTKVITQKTLLDLPIKKQIEIAGQCQLNHSEWVLKVKADLKSLEEHSEKFEWGVRPEGYTDDDAQRFQKKVDSAVSD